MKPLKTFARASAGLMLALLAGTGPAAAQTLPNPLLYLTRTEHYTVGATSFVRYRYDVHNKQAYPAAMFAAAPNLPPCGNNANSSRTWVDFFNARTNERIYGFCALGNPQSLGSIWFAMPEGTIPPSYVYVVLHDRQTNMRYRSNPADTVM